MAFEERRAFRRSSVKIDARLFTSNMFYSGKISNISETGMFINTRQCFEIGTILVIIIRNGKELERVFAKVQRVKRAHEDCDGLGVKIVSPSKGYSDFVRDLKATN